ncbi:BTAD domain-containing putative transcriptional regulator [Pseudonocardia sp. CA-107938]|uniref:AfsR/SARP family transcriptional regulator n=1 Tax=Pseudonocardia sp. CA-107938 TaxID=3240021 RepID=UPI003D948E49
MSVRAGATDRTPRPAKLRTLLALLLVRAPNPVPTDALIDGLWDADAPTTATTALQVYVSQLRQVLDPGRSARDPAQLLQTSRRGYRLRIDPMQCDLHRFRALADRGSAALAKGDPAAAADAFTAALRLWRGPVLADVASAALHTAYVPAATELWLAVHEQHAHARIVLDRPAPVIADLSAIVAEHPLRERLVALLMMALDQVGRRDEALRQYERTRTVLADELGIDPSPELRAVRERIRLGAPLRTARARATAQPSTTRGVPAQLPPAIADFAGRVDDLERVVAALTAARLGVGAPACCEIVGPGGIGKTTLAVQAAHRITDRFRDGQLVAELVDATGAPVDPAEVLRDFLLALGVDGRLVPRSLDERERLYRSILSDRRVLVVLDDAASERQVRPLIPGSAGCAVLMTGRKRLDGLEDVATVVLDVLHPAETITLLDRTVGGGRVAAEPVAAAAIAAHCGHLPLAVRIAGARLAVNPQLTLTEFAQSLADERSRLDELVAGNLAVRSSIGLSYRACCPEDQRALRTLARLRLAGFPAWVLAGLLDVDVRTGAEIVERLVDAQLVQVAGVDRMGEVRYRLGELVRLFAAEMADADPVDEINRGIGRVAEAMGTMLGRAERAVHPGSPAPPPRLVSWSVDDALLAGLDADPLGWSGSEYRTALDVLALAHEARLWAVTVRLAERIDWIVDVHSDWTGRRTAIRLALSAARQAGDRHGEAGVLRRAGDLAWDLGQAGAAVVAYTRARCRARALGDGHGEALALLGTAAVYADRGPLRRASALLAAAAPELARSGDRRGQAQLLRARGLLDRDSGRLDEAGESLAQAAEIFHELGDRRWWAYVLRGLVRVRRMQGRAAEAEQLGADCVAAFQLLSDKRWEGFALFSLAEVDVDQQRWASAEERFRRCIALFESVGDTRAVVQTLCYLGDVHRARGFPEVAVELLGGAMPRLAELGDPRALAKAGLVLGRAHRDTGRLDDAAHWLRRSVELYRRIGLESLADEAAADLHLVLADLAGSTG